MGLFCNETMSILSLQIPSKYIILFYFESIILPLIISYYTKLKMMWDELSTYTKIPTCSCAACTYGAAKEIAQQGEEEKVDQFPMGLDWDTYEII